MNHKDRKRVRQQAQTLFSKVVRLRDGKCMRCGKVDMLQCSHVRSKKAHPKLEFELDNAISLCHACHIYWWHKDVMEAADWFRSTFPAQNSRIEVLMLSEDTAPKIDYDTIIIDMNTRIDRLLK